MNKDFEKLSIAELTEKIKECQVEINKRLTCQPVPKKDINWDSVLYFVEENIVRKQAKDYEHYLFEYVLESIYGHHFWEWWNNKQNAAPQSDQ